MMGKSVVFSTFTYAIDSRLVNGYCRVETAIGDEDLHVKEINHCVYLGDLNRFDGGEVSVEYFVELGKGEVSEVDSLKGEVGKLS